MRLTTIYLFCEGAWDPLEMPSATTIERAAQRAIEHIGGDPEDPRYEWGLVLASSMEAIPGEDLVADYADQRVVALCSER